MGEYTLDDISASWLGHGKKIPIGESMAWLIKEVESLHNRLVNAGEVERTMTQQIAELNREHNYLKEQADKLDELEHKVAETAEKCGVSHDNDFNANETLDRIAGFYLDEVAHLKLLFDVHQKSVVWLIERGQQQHQSPTVWWAGNRVIGEWTDQVNLAIRFARPEDAELVGNMMKLGDVQKMWEVVKHAWV